MAKETKEQKTEQRTETAYRLRELLFRTYTRLRERDKDYFDREVDEVLVGYGD